jgi:hypothetical protein
MRSKQTRRVGILFVWHGVCKKVGSLAGERKDEWRLLSQTGGALHVREFWRSHRLKAERLTAVMALEQCTELSISDPMTSSC